MYCFIFLCLDILQYGFGESERFFQVILAELKSSVPLPPQQDDLGV